MGPQTLDEDACICHGHAAEEDRQETGRLTREAAPEQRAGPAGRQHLAAAWEWEVREPEEPKITARFVFV